MVEGEMRKADVDATNRECLQEAAVASKLGDLENAPFKGHLSNSRPATATLGCGLQGRGSQ